MSHDTLVGAHICVYNEEKNMREYLTNLLSVVDVVVMYDDGSTDRTVEIAREFLPSENIILGQQNDWSQEVDHFAQAFRLLCSLYPNLTHIATYAADERIPTCWVPRFREMVRGLGPRQAFCLKHLECYRSTRWWRVDQWWSFSCFSRFWHHDPELINYENRKQNKRGMHRFPIPLPARHGYQVSEPKGIRTVHLGFSTTEKILEKFRRYARIVDAGNWGSSNKYTNFVRFLDERTADYLPIPEEVRVDPWMEQPPEIDDGLDGPPKKRYPHGWLVDDEHELWTYINRFAKRIPTKWMRQRVTQVEV